MAEIRCPHCGKENPDFLDTCQFCQSPLKSESMLHFGEKPTKKNTSELEDILPDWLKSARQQSRDTAEDDALHVAPQPKPRKEEPRDLLAGLTFQSESSDDEEIPDWLSSINPISRKQPPAPSTPSSKPEPETDFFAQFNQQPSPQVEPTPPVEETPSPSQALDERDELSAWFSQSSEQPGEPFTFDQDPSQPNSDWGVGEQTPAPKEEEDLSWLRNLEAVAKQTDELKAPKTSPDWERELNVPSQNSEQDDLSWLNNLGAVPTADEPVPAPLQPGEKEDLSWLDSLGGASTAAAPDSSKEDLSWLDNLGGAPVVPAPSQPSAPQEDLSWLNSLAGSSEPAQPAPSSSSDDLDWLRNLGAPSTEEPASPSAASQEDLNWQNAFSAPVEPSQPAPAESSQEDLSWLNNLGGTPIEQPSTPQEDLNWLNAFNQTPEASQPAPLEPAAQDDLSWLNAFSETPETAQPTASQPAAQDDLSWLNSLQGEPETLSATPFAEEPAQEGPAAADAPHVSPFVPRKTAPLESETDASIPDWLKSATEEPSMPMNAGALDQFREDYKTPAASEEPFSWKSFTQGTKSADEQPAQPKPEPAFVDPNLFTPPAESSIPSAEDVNSLFSMEMPDWLSQAEPTQQEDASQPIGIHAEGGEALSPVDLPSWVQAMRPVDAVIAETVPSVESQPTEREGPLAGLRGVIPAIPVGSARRPKPVSLKLQTSNEQQASAAILEQLLAGETSPQPLVSAAAVGPQRILRWTLAAIFLLVLGAMVGLRSQMFATSALLPVESREVTTILQGIPDNSHVLVVLDYEAALAGEMEAVSGPLLDQMALLKHPRLSFVSTSSNGPALAERLLSNTNINQAGNGGLNYVAGQDYFNLGFLPGAEAGVLAFMQSSKMAIPAAPVNDFSEYEAVVVLTDNASSARIWIEQLHSNPRAGTPQLLVASSAQAGPLLQPYVASGQVDGVITGLADASRFEFVNNSRPGLARSYWDAFGIGLVMALGLIFFGSLWSLFTGIRARRAEAAEG